jgi:formylglycine-generating enzyme required for sulfatase activity
MGGAFWKKVNPFAANPSCFKTSPDHPVENISWNDAHEFIQKLISLNKNKYLFRLPTEAEWEYAARSCGKPEKFSGSAPLNDLAWYSANSGMTTRPVGMKKPNAIGLYDLSGNVYEWCEDNYSESAYKKHREKNPIISEEGPKRVIRGGSWCNSPHEMRCAYRAGVSQDFKSNYLGFRLVMTSVNRKMV